MGTHTKIYAAYSSGFIFKLNIQNDHQINIVGRRATTSKKKIKL